MTDARRAFLFSFALLLAAGCGTYSAVNPPLTQPASLASGYRWATTTIPQRTNRTFVILTFSGGGTRAAGLSYGVLQQLAATPMPGNHNLIDEVDVISSVSGGSFASMDYAMRGKQMLATFESAFLQKPVQSILAKTAFLNPRNLFKLLFDRNFHRIDVAVEVYDDVLFHNVTFADLLNAQTTNSDRPFVIANSTELEIGSRFEWTQDQFDPICSDLTPVHVARAVAASSDFPFLLPPMTLKKYDATACHYQTPSWLPIARDNDAYLVPSRPRYATELEGYLNPARQYLHLMDGGIADNIGLRGPLHALTSTDTFVQAQGLQTGFTLLPLLNQTPGMRSIDRVLVIVVNAGASGPVTIDKTPAVPGLKDIVGGISGTPMDNYSFDSIQLLLDAVGGRVESGVRFYPVVVSFPLLRDKTLRETVNGIGTNFNALTDAELAGLKQAAAVLVHQDPCFQQFVRDVNGTPTPGDAPICKSAPPPTK
jgi:NTE family protein